MNCLRFGPIGVLLAGAMVSCSGQDLKDECKFGLIVAYGHSEQEQKTSDEVAKQVKDALVNGWGFPAPLVQTPVNENAVRKDILRDFDDIEDKLKDRDPAKVDACYVKIHFQGHGYHGDPGQDAKANPPVKPPDQNKDHHAFVAADGSHIWDFELEERINRLSKILKDKKFKKQAVIVQVDFCWAEAMFGTILQNLPSNVNLAWSADKNHKCESLVGEGHVTGFTSGFTGAFTGDKPPTVEEAHKAATTQKDVKEAGGGYKSGDPKTAISPKL